MPEPLLPPKSCAALFQGPDQPWTFSEINHRMPQGAEILVRVMACTVCGSDLHTICGRRPSHPPAVLGHEIVGQIVAFGPQAPRSDAVERSLQLGDRIVWSLVASCSNCFYCNNGLPQKCSQGFKYGHQRAEEASAWQGGFAQHCLLVPGTTIVRLPDELRLLAACPLGCATSTIAAAFRIAQPHKHERILVVGAGMLGITATAFAHHLGLSEVVCMEPDPTRCQLATEHFGADFAGQSRQVADWVSEKHHGIGFDLIIECSGSNAGTLDALQLLRIGGRIVLVGAVFPSTPVPITFEEIVRRQWTIQGVHNYRSEDLVQAVNFMLSAQDAYPFEQLVRESFPLGQIDQAINAAQLKENIRVAILPE